MKPTSLPQHSRRGGLMAIALVGIGAVTIGLTAWVGLLSQRGRSAEVEEYATRRRIAAWNTRSAIREYALERMITSSGDSDGLNFDPLAGASVTSTAASSGYAMESNTRLAGLNAFSFSWDYPYSKVFDTTAGTFALGFSRTNANSTLQADYTAIASYLKTYIRSRCPVLGGDLLVVHRSSLSPPVAPAISGNLNVYGRVLHFVPELAASNYTARSARFTAPPGASLMALRPRDLNGNDIPPTNLAWTPVTFGRVNGITDFSGQMNVIDPDGPNASGNSLRQKLAASAQTLQISGSTAISDPRGFESDGNGLVTYTPCIGASNPADIPEVIIDSEVNEIVIEGQDPATFASYARYRRSTALLYVQDETSVRKLQTIRLRKQNARRLILAIKQEGTTPGLPVNIVVEDTGSTSEWNLVILAENTPIIFSADSPVSVIKIAGGIQTNSPLAGPGAGQSLSLVLQSDTRGLIKMTPRAAWVETLMPDKIPGSASDNTW